MLENQGGTVRAAAGWELCPWLNILRCFRLAVSLRALVLGAAGLLLTLIGWWFLSWVFSGDPQAAGWWQNQFGEGASPASVIHSGVPDEPDVPLVPRLESLKNAVPEGQTPLRPVAGAKGDIGWKPSGPLFGAWAQLTRPVRELFVKGEVSLAALVCLVLSGLWALAVWAFFGGAISRIAAVQLATDERVGWVAALRYAGSKWLAYFAAPLFPLLGILLATIPLFLFGLILRADVGLLLVSLVWVLFLLGGLVMSLLLLGLIFGWPLMWATISTEGTDSFDALSRSYAYVFQKPLRYLFYAIVAAVIGWLGWLLVKNFAAATVWLTLWAASWGCGAERMQEILSMKAADGESLAGTAWAGASVIHFWGGWVKLLALGYLYGYFWTATTAIYLLLRRDVDATEMDEVYLDADESEPAAGLPPVATEEAPPADEDVPEVVPEEVAPKDPAATPPGPQP